MSTPRNVAILIFDDVEILNISGPYEVFDLAGELRRPPQYYACTDCPAPDILVVPGGYGTRPLLRTTSPSTEIAADRRFVESASNILTAGGISAGIARCAEGRRPVDCSRCRALEHLIS